MTNKYGYPIFSMCEADEAQFEDTFNPYGRSNIAFERDSLDYLNADLVVDPLSGVAGYNPMCLGMFNMNFVFHSKLLVSPFRFYYEKARDSKHVCELLVY
ncbi:hypothetical protein DPMN_039599 [Dreissena polymorpha]|uniref:Uncharacterized protein n=1 Tax=Dreissena polymorpha TaxID=45954 RepID=A0A9D4CW74_DREPO|nr:hypothetical protein DPMN_039599 [Dreissena polymorpha]